MQIYELKLKKKPENGEFIVIWDDDIPITVEPDKWNKCYESSYKKFKSRKDIVFKKLGTDKLLEVEHSMPQNRQVRENVAMAQYKRNFKQEQ